MKQYLDLLQTIKDEGTLKTPARENMPKTHSLFGYQFRHNLADGFPLLTTKKINFKHIVTELLWFLKGDVNIKFLVDNGCNIWNEDAYNYYLKKCEEQDILNPLSFDLFCSVIRNSNDLKDLQNNSNKNSNFEEHNRNIIPKNYILGDCGAQYGWLMRNLKTINLKGDEVVIDQITDLIEGLRNNPMSRRHIINNWNVGTLGDMALNACHAFVQFNCRPIVYGNTHPLLLDKDLRPSQVKEYVETHDLPKYYLDCQMYQRSADVLLGVPYNIASYALLTEILAKLCNMIPGEYIHTFGDVHIYENHLEQVDEQLKRKPTKLPKLDLGKDRWEKVSIDFIVEEAIKGDLLQIKIENYNPQPRIKGKLSTGLIK